MRNYLVILFIIFISIPTLAEDQGFPRDSGRHFRFETNWRNEFNRTQLDNNTIYCEHYFSIHNVSPIHVQFKKLAIDNNDCYNNNSWIITLTLSKDQEIIETLNVTDNRNDMLEIKPNIKYRIGIEITHNCLNDGKYNIIIQMNIVNDEVDEPYYFYEIVNYKTVIQKKDNEQSILSIILTVICLAGIMLILIKKGINLRKK